MTDLPQDFFNRPLAEVDPDIAQVLDDELGRQQRTLEMIASENFVPQAVLEAQGSVLTNKYAEGYPGQALLRRLRARRRRRAARDRPRQGAVRRRARQRPAARRRAGQRVRLPRAAAAGRHDHGPRAPARRPPEPRHEDQRVGPPVRHRAVPRARVRLAASTWTRSSGSPRSAGPSSCSPAGRRTRAVLDFERFRAIADEVGALLMVDMAHFAGLVAAGLHPNPVPYADVVTTTIHKTLGGARGGMILSTRGARQEDQLGGVPGPAGRPAHARHRRQGDRAEDRRERGVPRAPAAHGRRRAGGRRAAARRGQRRQRPDRRHRRAPRARRPARVRARRPAGRGPPARHRHHRQPQRGPVRPAAAGGLVGPARRHARRSPPAASRRTTSARSARSSRPRSARTSTRRRATWPTA